ncbi:hypothetical protein DIPPA_31886 [Diplonema papillatum]|nr:hypothetical protein DIPPA_31886 [Diplonema papillatum]
MPAVLKQSEDESSSLSDDEGETASSSLGEEDESGESRFHSFLQHKLGMSPETLRSYMNARAWIKKEAALRAEFEKADRERSVRPKVPPVKSEKATKPVDRPPARSSSAKAPPEDTQEEGPFAKFLQKRLDMSAETLRSYMNSRAWSKKEDMLRAEFEKAERSPPPKEKSAAEATPEVPTPAAIPSSKETHADNPFTKFLQKKLGMSAETLRSYQSSRAWGKREAALRDEFAKCATEDKPVELQTRLSSSSLDSMSDDDKESEDKLSLAETAIDAYILSKQWVPDTGSLHSFKSSKKYLSKYYPQIVEALSESNAPGKAPASQPVTSKPPNLEETHAEPVRPMAQEKVSEKATKRTLTEAFAAESQLLITGVPAFWIDVADVKRSQERLALEQHAHRLGESARETALVKRKADELLAVPSVSLLARLSTVLKTDISQSLTSLRPLTLDSTFIGSCILSYQDSKAAQRTWEAAQQLAGVSSSPVVSITTVCQPQSAQSDVCVLSVTMLRPSVPAPVQPDGKFSVITLHQPPDVAPAKKPKYERKTWWQTEYMHASPKVEPTKPEKPMPTAAKNFEEFVMLRQGLVEGSLESYMGSRKFSKIKDQLEKEYQQLLS